MIRDLIASILFTIAALVFINFVGDFAFTMSQAQNEEQMIEAPAPEMAPEMAPETAQEPEPQPAAEVEPAAEPQPAAEAEPAAEPQPAAEAEPAAAVEETAAQATASQGDAEKGRGIFRKKCMVCHTIAKGEKDRTGPNLWSIVGRQRASSETFKYSNPMKTRGGIWSETEISSFIAGPRSYIPDTKMTFAGLKNAQDRADVIAYLKTQTD